MVGPICEGTKTYLSLGVQVFFLDFRVHDWVRNPIKWPFISKPLEQALQPTHHESGKYLYLPLDSHVASDFTLHLTS
jgi:hypothetical protein